MSLRGAISLVVVLFAGLLWPGGVAAQVNQTVDFEDYPVGTALDQAYQSIGLSIPGARIDTVPRSQFGRQVVRLVNTGPGQPPPLTLVFASAQQYVGFFAGSSAPGRAFVRGAVLAFDSLNNVVAQQAQESVIKGADSTLFGVRTAQPSIRRVVLQLAVYNPTVSGGVGSGLDVSIDHLVLRGLAPPRRTHVPDLTGMTLAQAVARLADSGLLLKDEANRPKLPGPGTVAHQAPDPGTPAAAGDSVSVTLVYVDPNKGKKPVRLTHVPDLTNLTRKQAALSLADSGLNLGLVDSAIGKGKPNTVFRQVPLAGDTITPGRAVDVTLVRAVKPPPVRPTVPNLYGRTQAEADSILRAVNLGLGHVTEAIGPTKPGTIFHQTPPFESPAKPGELVDVVIASKPAPPIHWPWWVWAALGAGGVGAGTAGVRGYRRRLQRRRFKAALRDDSLEWTDSAPAEHGSRAVEVRFRVTLGLDDDDRAESP